MRAKKPKKPKPIRYVSDAPSPATKPKASEAAAKSSMRARVKVPAHVIPVRADRSFPKSGEERASEPVDGVRREVLADAGVARLMAHHGFLQALGKIHGVARDGQKAAGESDEALLLYTRLAVGPTKRTGRTLKENFERRFAQDTGKTWKALAEFPDRLRRLAEEVKGLSRSPFFDPLRTATTILPDNTHWDFAKRDFCMLHLFLESYSYWLDERVKRVSALGKHFYRRAPRGKLSLFTIHVSEQVKLTTGGWHDRLVADLLNAADLVLNPDTAKCGPRFDEQSIVLQRSRNKTKNPKT
jgi:hypothetical protein